MLINSPIPSAFFQPINFTTPTRALTAFTKSNMPAEMSAPRTAIRHITRSTTLPYHRPTRASVHDMTADLLRLTVEGESESTATASSAWTPPGSLVVKHRPPPVKGSQAQASLAKLAFATRMTLMGQPSLPVRQATSSSSVQQTSTGQDVEMSDNSSQSPSGSSSSAPHPVGLDFDGSAECAAFLEAHRRAREPSPALGNAIKPLPFPWQAGYHPSLHKISAIEARWREFHTPSHPPLRNQG